jgi:tRNA nucleotidyltransferase/poly(A) polymerase
MYLKEKAGVSYSEIKDTISAIRRPEVAFFDTIYEKIRAERELMIGEDRFHTVLYLLERCGMLTSLTKKVYFAPESQAWAA